MRTRRIRAYIATILCVVLTACGSASAPRGTVITSPTSIPQLNGAESAAVTQYTCNSRPVVMLMKYANDSYLAARQDLGRGDIHTAELHMTRSGALYRDANQELKRTHPPTVLTGYSQLVALSTVTYRTGTQRLTHDLRAGKVQDVNTDANVYGAGTTFMNQASGELQRVRAAQQQAPKNYACHPTHQQAIDHLIASLPAIKASHTSTATVSDANTTNMLSTGCAVVSDLQTVNVATLGTWENGILSAISHLTGYTNYVETASTEFQVGDNLGAVNDFGRAEQAALQAESQITALTPPPGYAIVQTEFAEAAVLYAAAAHEAQHAVLTNDGSSFKQASSDANAGDAILREGERGVLTLLDEQSSGLQASSACDSAVTSAAVDTQSTPCNNGVVLSSTDISVISDWLNGMQDALSNLLQVMAQGATAAQELKDGNLQAAALDFGNVASLAQSTAAQIDALTPPPGYAAVQSDISQAAHFAGLAATEGQAGAQQNDVSHIQQASTYLDAGNSALKQAQTGLTAISAQQSGAAQGASDCSVARWQASARETELAQLAPTEAVSVPVSAPVNNPVPTVAVNLPPTPILTSPAPPAVPTVGTTPVTHARTSWDIWTADVQKALPILVTGEQAARQGAIAYARGYQSSSVSAFGRASTLYGQALTILGTHPAPARAAVAAALLGAGSTVFQRGAIAAGSAAQSGDTAALASTSFYFREGQDFIGRAAEKLTQVGAPNLVNPGSLGALPFNIEPYIIDKASSPNYVRSHTAIFNRLANLSWIVGNAVDAVKGQNQGLASTSIDIAAGIANGILSDLNTVSHRQSQLTLPRQRARQALNEYFATLRSLRLAHIDGVDNNFTKRTSDLQKAGGHLAAARKDSHAAQTSLRRAISVSVH